MANNELIPSIDEERATSLFWKRFIIVGILGCLMLIYGNIIVQKYFSKTFFQNNKSIVQDNDFNFLYYDKDVESLGKEIFPDALLNISTLVDDIKRKDIKIFVTDDEISDTYKRICMKKNKNVPEGAVGLYVSECDFIIIKLVDMKSYPVEFKKDYIVEFNKKYGKNIDVDKKNLVLGDFFDKEELEKYNKEYNVGTLYHEIGHFLDDISKSPLSTDRNFIKLYNEEKDAIFPDDPYNKSNINEYIAECTSNYILKGYIGSKEKDKDTVYETTIYIKKLIEEFS